MKRYCLTAALLVVSTLSLIAKPINVTLDGKDFLSISGIRRTETGSDTGYSVPESALKFSPEVDLLFHFDGDGEIPEGNYKLVKGVVLTDAESRKIGTASGRFHINESTLSVQPTPSALFASQNEPGDFTIQFFINPTVIENNEILIYWSNTLSENNRLNYQSMICSVRDRRLVWSFERFFRNTFPKIEIAGKTKINPREWSFHRLSYNSRLNLLEYSMNGKQEKILYLTPDGNEDKIDCSPRIGNRLQSTINIALRYSGKMDELAILRTACEPDAPKLFPESGKILFRCLDLGYSASYIEEITLNSTVAAETAVNGYYRLSEQRLDYIRWNESTAESPGLFSASDGWIPFTPGRFDEKARGRYLQIAIKLIPDTVAEISPYFNSLSLSYTPNLPPLPPIALTAIPGNGSVTLDWIPAIDIRIRGYRISYGTAPGHYSQSFDIKNPEYTFEHHQQHQISGLDNDVMYYFAIQPYDDSPVRQYGDFSSEVSARPGRIHQPE